MAEEVAVEAVAAEVRAVVVAVEAEEAAAQVAVEEVEVEEAVRAVARAHPLRARVRGSLATTPSS